MSNFGLKESLRVFFKWRSAEQFIKEFYRNVILSAFSLLTQFIQLNHDKIYLVKMCPILARLTLLHLQIIKI